MRYFLAILFALNLSSGFAQQFETGLLSGMGFTDFHGNTGSGKWQTMTGAVSGVFFRYSLSPVLSVSTELNYSVQQYYYKPYQYYQPYYYPEYYFNYSYYVNQERWDFGFWRIPIYLTLHTPTRLQFSVSAGVYLSFTHHQEHSSNYWYPYPWYKNSIYLPTSGYENESPRHDNGMLYAAALSYPLSSAFHAFIQGRYFIGHREFIEPQQGRTGVSEVVFGIGYNGLFKSKKNPAVPGAGNDTMLSRFTVTPRFGMNWSGVKGSGWPEAYAVKPGVSVAVGLEFRLDRTFSLLSGVGFERKGYHMQDSSIYYFMHAEASWSSYQLDTRVDLDYATIPLQLKISMGSGTRIYLTAGAYWGIKLNARVTGTAEIENASEYGYSRNAITVYDDIERYIRNNDFGWLFGAGVEVPVFRGHKLELGVQYALGKTDILREEELSHDLLTESEDVLRNGSLVIHAGFAFPIPSMK